MSKISYLKRVLFYALTGAPVKTVTATITLTCPNERLKNKKIIITGGGKGIGLAMAKKFKDEGASVLISGRDEKKLKLSAEEIGCNSLILDVQKPETFSSFIATAAEIMGGIDTLVNNAGVSLHESSIREVSCEQFDAQFNTNLRGGYFLSQKFIEYFENNKRNAGNILFISSERGRYVDDIPYGLTKVAINSLIQGLSKRVIKSDIRVNGIGPGVTATALTGISPSNLYNQNSPRERTYLPEEIAEVACFLLSDIASCISGQIITCDEGKSGNSYWK